jgi:hypothetical protein
MSKKKSDNTFIKDWISAIELDLRVGNSPKIFCPTNKANIFEINMGEGTEEIFTATFTRKGTK